MDSSDNVKIAFHIAQLFKRPRLCPRTFKKVDAIRSYTLALITVAFLQLTYSDGSLFPMPMVHLLRKASPCCRYSRWVPCTCKYDIRHNHAGIAYAQYTVYLCTVLRSRISSWPNTLQCVNATHYPSKFVFYRCIFHFPGCYVFLVFNPLMLHHHF